MIWFFPIAVPELTIEQSYYISGDNQLVLVCDTRGSPPTATLWSRDDTLVTSNSDYGVTEKVILTEYASTQYSNTLTLTDSVFGAISCAAYSDWVSTDKEQSGRQSEPFVCLFVSCKITSRGIGVFGGGGWVAQCQNPYLFTRLVCLLTCIQRYSRITNAIADAICLIYSQLANMPKAIPSRDPLWVVYKNLYSLNNWFAALGKHELI